MPASTVRLSVARDPHDGPDGREMLQITVDDDGPGLSKEQRTEALQRGRRLDESKPGSGLGLSIVGDLAELYRGTFALDEAPQGGLRARLNLPQA